MDMRIFKFVVADRTSSASLEIVGGRTDGDAPYYLKFGGEFTFYMSLDQARRLASSIKRLAFRLRNTGTAEKAQPAAIYKQRVGDGDGTAFKIELGVVGDGNSVYVEAGSVKAVAEGTCRDDLLFFLEAFAADITAISTMSEPQERRPYSPSRDYRSKWLSVWD